MVVVDDDLAPVAALDSRLMRSDPPAATLAWLVDALDAASVNTVEAMRGGSTAAMHRVTLRWKSGTSGVVVLRRYVLGHVLATEPGVVHRELAALELVASAAIPTPELLAADPDATVTDAPTVVMSLLGGRPRWDSSPRQRWLDQIVDAALEFQALDAADTGRIGRFQRYTQHTYDPPRWSQNPTIWERAVEIFHGPIPDDQDRFIHRDFHPGNLLWHRRHLTGVVDWQAACAGPASVDPAHCRLNMFFDDPALADQLQITWDDRSPEPLHPWADINAIIGVLDHIRTPKRINPKRAAIEHALAKAVADLAG